MGKLLQGDALLLSTPDGGDLKVENDLICMSSGLENSIYLSLFGGNREDDATDSTKKNQWWGNELSDTADENLRSRTLSVLLAKPAIPSSINSYKDAILYDLNWIIKEKLGDTIDISISLGGKNRVDILIEIKKNEETVDEFKFSLNLEALRRGC